MGAEHQQSGRFCEHGEASTPSPAKHHQEELGDGRRHDTENHTTENTKRSEHADVVATASATWARRPCEGAGCCHGWGDVHRARHIGEGKNNIFQRVFQSRFFFFVWRLGASLARRSSLAREICRRSRCTVSGALQLVLVVGDKMFSASSAIFVVSPRVGVQLASL